MTSKKIYFVTGNKNKAKIFQKVMYPEVKVKQLVPRKEIKEKRSLKVEDVISDKLNKARKMFKNKEGYIFVTDVGFHIKALNGRPGALIKRETKKRFDGNFSKWCYEINNKTDRNVIVKMIIGADNCSEKIFIERNIEGTIPKNPKNGNYGFGWDNIFVPDWQKYGKDLNNKSLAQVKPQHKLEILRKPIIEKFKNKLQNK